MTAPTVSVIISTYNHGHYLAEAIQSVLDQTFQDFELIVVDDGSTDNTRQVIAEFGNAIQYIYQENRGYAAARNVAIRRCQGAIITFLDADDVWLPQKLVCQVDYFDQHADVGVVSTNCYYIDANGILIGKRRSTLQVSGWLFEQLLFKGNSIAMPTVAIRQQCFAEVGLFDESLRTTVDWDLWLRLSRKYPFGYIDQYLAKYRLHAANMHKKADIKAEDILTICDKLFAEPDLPPVVKRKQGQAYSVAHLNIAWRYINSGQLDTARQHLMQAIRLYPRHLLNLFFLRLLMAIFLDAGFYERLRNLRVRLV